MCQRDNSPAADSKIEYIISVLNRIGYGVDHISRAPSSCKHFIPYYIEHNGNNTIRYFASLGKTKSMLRVLNRLFMDAQFFLWCLFHVKKGEQIIVYHSLGYSTFFINLCRLKKVRIIGEIEEIYQDVHKQRKSLARNEYRFIDVCDKYIFPTSLLNDKVNKNGKPYIVVHGVYSVENLIEGKNEDGKIHIVYGGTLDPNKGGAAAAVAAAEFLSENYHVHICGFGDPSEIKTIIKEVSLRAKANVTFEGELKGNAYKHFIQRCHIGLSTQNPNAAFNATSFPSKILVYLSNGLKVVSIRILAIEQSAVASSIFFYDIQEPKAIAEAIEKAVETQLDGRDVLKELDKIFKEKLKTLITQ